MGQAPSSESQLQQPLHTAQATRADLEGQAHATMQWESQMKAKQQDILRELENPLKEGKQRSFPIPVSTVRCA